MQLAQHAANNFQILSCGLHKIKAFPIKSAVKTHCLGDILAKNRDFGQFSSQRLKKGCFRLFKAFLGFSRLRFFNLKSHDLRRSCDSERLK